MYNDKQYHTRRLKPLKSVLNPTLYQFILWTTNQRWWYKFEYTIKDGNGVEAHCYYKLWK